MHVGCFKGLAQALFESENESQSLAAVCQLAHIGPVILQVPNTPRIGGETGFSK